MTADVNAAHATATVIVILCYAAIWIGYARAGDSGVAGHWAFHNATQTKLRGNWLSLFFAPFGATCRWKLSRFNGDKNLFWMRRRWRKWFFSGTFSANVLACLCNGVLGCAMYVSPLPHSASTTIFVSGVGTGFNGCLSTVSTFVTEIRKLTPKVRVPGERPSARPALYAGTSVVIGLGLFLLVNGPGYAHQWSPSAK